MNLNHIYFGGNLTSQPELKSTPNGTKVCSFSLASNRTWKNDKGEKVEAVEFGNCVMFGVQAENFCKYAVKGQNFLIEGRIQTRAWDDKDTGKKMYRTEIMVERFHFGAKPQGTYKPANTDEQSIDYGADGGFATVPEKPKRGVEKDLGTIDYGEAINPADIPF